MKNSTPFFGHRFSPDAQTTAAASHGAKLGKANHKKAVQTARELKATVQTLKAEGITTVRGIADALNARGVATPQGKQWHGTSVHRLLKRVETVI